ncbi:MAG: hypothetical protein WAV90_05695 [Gordonia amarae]
MRYRIESNVDRGPATAWFDHVPEKVCAALNLDSYLQGRGGEWGIYDEAGRRVA